MVLAAPVRPAQAAPAVHPVDRFWRWLQERLAPVGRPLPRPSPLALTWQARQLGGGPSEFVPLAATGADLDGDRRAELVVLGARAAQLLRIERAGSVTPVARLALPGPEAPLRPRTPVGALVVTAEGGATVVRARSSELGAGAVLAWRSGQLLATGSFGGFPLCGEQSVEMWPGRHLFATAAFAAASAATPGTWPEVRSPVLTALCREFAGASSGAPLRVHAVVDVTGQLLVRRAGPCTGAVCVADVSVPGVGYALDIADVDLDGVPELIASGHLAPGEADRVVVARLAESGPTPLFTHTFGGAVVAVAAADFAGDGRPLVVVAVRPVGTPGVELWTLN